MDKEGDVIVTCTPGYRFYPTEEELITFYLKHKIQGTNNTLLETINRLIPQLNVYDIYPSDLPQHAGEVCQGDPEQWFFFVPRNEKEARGGRTSRLTRTGYWKATGSPSVVYSSGNQGIGIRRTMVFYNGRAPIGKKTKWKMNEYKAFQEQPSSHPNPNPKLMHEFSLCRIYIKANCLRAFDRRPSRVEKIEPRAIQQTLHSNVNDHEATTSTHSYYQSTTMERMTSSNDHSYNISEQDMTINNFCTMRMEMEDQPLWDWDEHHNWLSVFQNDIS